MLAAALLLLGGLAMAAPEPGVELGEGILLVNRGGKEGLVDAAGKELVPVENRFVTMGRQYNPLRSTLPLILQAPDHSAIVVTRIEHGQPVIVRYDEIQLEGSGSSTGPKAWVVRRGGKWGAIDTDGHELLPPIYDEMTRVAEGGQAGFRSFRLGTKLGLLNPQMGRVVLPAEFDWIEPTADFYWPRAAKKDGKLGIVDDGGRVLAPFRYDAIDSGGPSWPRRAQRDGQWGLLDRWGHELVPPRFDALEPAEGPEGTLYFVRQGKLWGALDAKNHTILRLKYDKLEGVYWKYCWAVERGQGAWIDLKGHRVDPASPRLSQAHHAIGPEVVPRGLTEPAPLDATAPAKLRLVASPAIVPLRFANLVGSGEPDATPHPNRLVEGRPGIRTYFLVTVENDTDQPFDPFTDNGAYLIGQEAQDRSGAWRPLEYRLPPDDNMGPPSPIPPRMKRESLARRYEGPFKTKLRLVMVTGKEPLVSEPYEGTIDERQLQKPSAPGAQQLRDLQRP